MEGFQDMPNSYIIPVNSYDTALCVLPPAEQCEHIDSLRELYDKAYGRWPAHINIIYPFVAPEHLPQAQQQIQAQFQRNLDSSGSKSVKLNSEGLFQQQHNSTAVLHESRQSSDGSLETLRYLALQALGHKSTSYRFHLTVGQTEDNSTSSLEFLLSKVRLLPTLDFKIGSLAILIRDRTTGKYSTNRMRLWGAVHVVPPTIAFTPAMSDYWHHDSLTSSMGLSQDIEKDEILEPTIAFSRAVKPGKTFSFDKASCKWVRKTDSAQSSSRLTSLNVSSYNVLIDSEYPLLRDRNHLLIDTLLSNSAKADILVLQEVSDDFLSSLLDNTEVQDEYPFTSHAPPSQPDVGPLPSFRNVVILSKWPFRWEFVPFHRKHKGAVVADFGSLIDRDHLVIAGVHLTCGLTDGSVAARKVQIQNLLTHLNRHYSSYPWVIAGDFNLATSTHTIDNALKNDSISIQTGSTLTATECLLSDDEIVDAWSVTREEQSHEVDGASTDELFAGEEGATFDPRNNILAAATSGTSQNRPQRYDRILVRSQKIFHIASFNMFGLPTNANGSDVVPSDHYGVRTSLELLKSIEQLSPGHCEMLDEFKVKPHYAPYLTTQELALTLSRHRMLLTKEERSRREFAFDLLKQIVLGSLQTGESIETRIPLVMVTVGSHAMKVETLESDIDCLCIGTISSKTFFKLARQRIQKAETQGIRILRKVEAGTGTMLELSVNGIPMDLQYCHAAQVVERWPEFEHLPPSDSIFNLSIVSLRKLKAYRDLLYMQKTLPNLVVFRMAYRAIKLWAIQRGVYSSKLGFLGGIHITLMLSWVYKRVAHDANAHGPYLFSANDLVATFFHHYANFDWANDMVFDAFFHKQQPRYHRTTREPMVVLGFHAPNFNVAHTSTLPGLRVLIKEFQAASLRISEYNMTWQGFFEPPNLHSSTGMRLGESQFLQGYKSYVSIDIQYWGRTLARVKSLVGWVESRCLSLVVNISRVFPHIEVRLWPSRFTDTESANSSEANDYHGCYLIGLGRAETDSSINKNDERKLAKQSLETVIDRFLTQLKTDEKNYDASTSWINISLASRHDIQAQKLRLDDREWVEFATEIDPDSDDEEALDGLDEEDAEVLKFPVRSRLTPTSIPVSTKKLRPASDVLNRLRWDPNLDPADYIIGYEDRFLGPRETSLEKWKTEQTDEEFIPQHRILYFRRRFNDEGDGKGEIVWERATRIDRVFGSGLSAEN